jgi:hypothetical protein
MPAFLIRGHGEEKHVPFSERKRIPPGITLVTVAECGEITSFSMMTSFWTAFGDPSLKEMFLDPIAYETELSLMLGKPIRIYTEGDLYPNLNNTLLVNWSNTTYQQSGVYSFPSETDFSYKHVPYLYGPVPLKRDTFDRLPPLSHTPGSTDKQHFFTFQKKLTYFVTLVNNNALITFLEGEGVRNYVEEILQEAVDDEGLMEYILHNNNDIIQNYDDVPYAQAFLGKGVWDGAHLNADNPDIWEGNTILLKLPTDGHVYLFLGDCILFFHTEEPIEEYLSPKGMMPLAFTASYIYTIKCDAVLKCKRDSWTAGSSYGTLMNATESAEWETIPFTLLHDSTRKETHKDFLDLYEGSLLPTREQVQRLEQKEEYSMEEIFSLGPGVYYNLMCRSLFEYTKHARIQNALRNILARRGRSGPQNVIQHASILYPKNKAIQQLRKRVQRTRKRSQAAQNRRKGDAKKSRRRR